MNDIKLAFRRLWHSPGYLAAGMLAFTLGIGINIAIFSVCDALLFRPIELAHLNRLLLIEPTVRGVGQGVEENSPADFVDYQSQLKSFESMAAATDWSVTLTGQGEPEVVSGYRVSANWMDTLGTPILLGRAFRPGEDQPGNNRSVVLSHGLFLRRFAGDPKIVGQRIQLNGESHEVIGVIKDTGRFPSAGQIFAPLAITPEWKQRRSDFYYLVAGRLRAGVSAAEAQSELSALQARFVKDYPKSHEFRGAISPPLQERVIGSNDVGPRFVRMIFLAAGFVLLIAIANVANLQLARVTGRSREFAIQSALGASSWQVARQVLCESTLLAVLGAALGCEMAVWGVDVLQKLLPSEIWQYLPMWPYVHVNAPALAWATLCALVAGVLSGILPAIVSFRPDAQDSLREGGRAMTSSAQRHWFRGALVMVQMCLALVLLIGAGLMVRGSQAMIFRAPEKQLDQIASLRSFLPAAKYPSNTARQSFYRQLEERLRAVPGQRGAALVSSLPFSDSLPLVPVAVEGQAEVPLAQRNNAVNLFVSSGYFDVMRVALLSGRSFNSSDGPEQNKVCVIDQSLATRLFGTEKPLGRKLSPAFNEQRDYCEIVGVVAPQIHSSWDRSTRPALYRLYSQNPSSAFTILLRGDNAGVLPLILAGKKAVLAVDPDQPVTRLYSVQDVQSQALAGLQMLALMMSIIGVVALVLACVGIYSVVSHTVAERTSEIGMRMAMGAQPLDVFGVVARQSLITGAVGIAVGLSLGYALAQLLNGLVFGVSASDFWILSSVSLLLALVGLLAIYIPARRAIRLDPIAALRHD
jgi:putative ABC transport system permease protein